MNMNKPTAYPTCSTCKRWIQEEEEVGGTCGRIPSAYDHDERLTDQQPAQVNTDMSKSAWLMTLPTFGCGLHSDLTEVTP